LSELRARKAPVTVKNRSGENVSLIHQDYGSAQGKRHRTDVVILRPVELRNSTGIEMKVDDRYAQPLVALEFGTEKSEKRRREGRGIDLCAHTERDFKKLRETKAVHRRLVICYRNRSALRKRNDHRRALEERMTRLLACVHDLSPQYPETTVRPILVNLLP
jgi:hypothetical protein